MFVVETAYVFTNSRYQNLYYIQSDIRPRGPSIKYVTLFLMIFDPPFPLSQTVTNLGPPKSMSHF